MVIIVCKLNRINKGQYMNIEKLKKLGQFTKENIMWWVIGWSLFWMLIGGMMWQR